MKKVVQTIFLSLFVFMGLSACTQKYGIYKAQAYLRESSRGTQMVNEANQPVGSTRITENLLYIETALNKTPQFTYAWIEGKPYKIQLQKVEAGTTIGTLKDSDKPAVVAAKEGRQLWQALLTEDREVRLDSSISGAVRASQVVLTGTWKEKAFAYEIPTRISLESVLYQ
jgi:hypothetical protein